MYVGLLPKKLNTKVPGLFRGCEEKTHCDCIDFKSIGSLFYPSKDLLEEVENYEKILKKYMQSLWIEFKILSKTIITSYYCNKQPMASWGC